MASLTDEAESNLNIWRGPDIDWLAVLLVLDLVIVESLIGGAGGIDPWDGERPCGEKS